MRESIASHRVHTDHSHDRFAQVMADLLDHWRPTRNGHRLWRLGQRHRTVPIDGAGVRRAGLSCGHVLDGRTAERVVDALAVLVDARRAAEAAEPHAWQRWAAGHDEQGRRIDGWTLEAGRSLSEPWMSWAIRPRRRRAVAA